MTSLGVRWTEGLPLSPQHLQQLERTWGTTLEAAFDALGFAPTGLAHLELDGEALQRGLLAVRRCVAVFSGGVALRMQEGDAIVPAARPLPDAHEVRVSLALPRSRGGGCYVGPAARFRSTTATIVDRHSDTSAAIEVELLSPNLRVVFDGEDDSDCDVLPIALLRRTGVRTFAPHDTWIPPAIRLQPCAALEHRLDRLLSLFATRLAGHAPLHDDPIVALHVRAQLGAGLAVLRSLRRDETPLVDLHRELARMVGMLAPLGLTPPTTPLDRHAPEAAFEAVFGPLETLFTKAPSEGMVTIDLAPREDGVHLGRLDARAARCVDFLLAIESTLAVHDASEAIPRLGKVASFEQIAGVVNAALPGARLTGVGRPPPLVRLGERETLFRLERADAFFEVALRSGTLAVYLPEPFRPGSTKVRLVGLDAPRSTHA